MCLYIQNYISDNEYKCCIFTNKIILNIYYVSFLLGFSILTYSRVTLVSSQNDVRHCTFIVIVHNQITDLLQKKIQYTFTYCKYR